MRAIWEATAFSLGGILIFGACQQKANKEVDHPNILIAISDDQTFLHTSFAGCGFVNTPGFDRIAGKGIYFTNCYAGSPGSAPSRSSLVTGRYHWQNEQSGQHASSWMKKYVPFTDLLAANGYHTGYTGKGVDPFQYARDEADSLWRKENAAGKGYNSIRYEKYSPADERFADGIGAINYMANFRTFMDECKEGQPFFFWYGATEPHRVYEKDSWKKNGKDPSTVNVPGFLPDNIEIRGDLLDYAVEIEWFDLHLSRMLNYLDSIGELDNTIVIVTGDNGMPFPRAKANCYDYGLHVPLAICYPAGFPGKRIVDDPVSFVDIAPTILEMTDTEPEGMMPMSGKSLAGILRSKASGTVDETRKYIYAGRERHSSSRWKNLGYPQRVIRNRDYLLIWNIKPDRWPAGDPQAIDPESASGELQPMFGIDGRGIHHSEWAFTDVDASPSKSFLIENHSEEDILYFFNLAFGKRSEYELYAVKKDPFCLDNLSGQTVYTGIENELKKELMRELEQSGDPRVAGPYEDIFETYIRYSPIREFPQPDHAEQ
jgi:N-sulfoglucosamine sulfohydrolase